MGPPSAQAGPPQDAAYCRMWFSADDLSHLRRTTAQWAARAGLPPSQADDFMIAVNEIATNAVRYGSPLARLELRTAEGPAVLAEISDERHWTPDHDTAAVSGRGGMGLALTRRICDEVEIRAGNDGTTVILRMKMAR